LWTSLLDLLAEGRVDYTMFFRKLGNFATGIRNERLRGLFATPAKIDEWAERYRERLEREDSNDSDRKSRMDRVNPKFILRNYLAQIAIQKADLKDYSEVDRLRGVLRFPFDEQPEMEHYAKPAPEWGKRLVVSCSS